MISKSAELKAILGLVGIEAQMVVYHAGSAVYQVEFRPGDLKDFYSEGTQSAEVWAKEIEAKLPHLVVVDTFDSVAEWRPAKPILFAICYLKDVNDALLPPRNE